MDAVFHSAVRKYGMELFVVTLHHLWNPAVLHKQPASWYVMLDDSTKATLLLLPSEVLKIWGTRADMLAHLIGLLIPGVLQLPSTAEGEERALIECQHYDHPCSLLEAGLDLVDTNPSPPWSEHSHTNADLVLT